MEQTPQRNVGPLKTEATKRWSAVAAKGSKASQSASNSERIYTETKKAVPEASVKDNTKDSSNVNSTSSTSNKRFTNTSNPRRVNNASRTSSANNKSWKTDAAISSHRGSTEHRERELLPWRPDPQDASASLMSLEESVDRTGGGEWDQFAANEELFGVQSQFDEEQYTSTINRSHPKYKERAQEADRIAKEIESSTTDNVHLAEERGRKTDDSGLDEEDLYSGVQRSSQLGKPNNRGPPSRENYSQGKDRDNRPRNAGPRNGLLPNDPAIVSQRHMAFSRGGDSRAAEKFFNARRKMGTLSKGEKEGQIKEFMQFSKSLNLGGFGSKGDSAKGNKDASKEKQKPFESAGETTKVDVSENITKQKEEVPSKDVPSLEKKDKEPTLVDELNKEEKTQEIKEEEAKPQTSLESNNAQEKPVNKEPSKPLKLNAKAASFKPNVGAPVFTPGKFVLPPKPAASQSMTSRKSSSTEAGMTSNAGTPGDNKERPFFPNGGSRAESSVMENFNVIKTAAGQEQIGETLEKPFSCPPTWASGPNDVQHIVSNQKVEIDASQGKRNSATGAQVPGLVLPNGPMSPAMPAFTPGVPYVPFGYQVPGYPPYMRAPSQQPSVAASPNATPTSGNSSAVASPMFMAPPVMPPYGVPPFQAQGNSPRGVAPATYYVPQMGGMGGMPMMPYPVNGVPPMYGQYAMNNGMMNMRYPAYTDFRRSSSQRSFNPSRGNRHQNNGYKNDNYTNNHNNSNDGNNATDQSQDSNAAAASNSQVPESSEVVEPAPTAETSDEKTS
ncbi:ataxin-2-like protein [Schizosaccharomyces osmophilus]|uniref:Ataxin-2-like protein n=1 Tax=Schizosaccharomyces osmophilus TaxID=2545709 RepID=A0AAE9W8H3_9SCHI|nr:ataxin-2-like protein [Schizosaccharomyces osmophilus]WBW71737.1 ataxin-2-like protein [Schizosaccharomyces osmophilus]